MIDVEGSSSCLRVSAPARWALTASLLWCGLLGQAASARAEGAALYAVALDPLRFAPSEALRAPTPQTASALGYAVSRDGDRLALGAPREDAGAADAGAIYVFTRAAGQWRLEERITAPMLGAQARLGEAVALHADTLVASAPGAHGGDGEVIILERRVTGAGTQWAKVASVQGIQGLLVTHSVGQAVALHGDTLALGYISQPAIPLTRRGGVAVLSRHQGGPNAWGVVERITEPNSLSSSEFGAALALSADGQLLVGAPGRTDGQRADVGVAYLFAQDQGGADRWGRVATLTPPIRQAGQRFGSSVALDERRALIGAPGDLTGAGRAYLFERDRGGPDQWDHARTLSASNASGRAFGTSVALRHDRLAVGEPKRQADGLDAGAAHVFERNQGGAEQWGLLQTILPSATQRGQLGQALAMDDQALLIGAPKADAPGAPGSGAVITAPYERAERVDERVNTPPGAGHALAADARTLVLGSPRDDARGEGAGAITIYTLSGLTHGLAQLDAASLGAGATLRGATTQAGDRFGHALALRGDTLIVGAPQLDAAPMQAAPRGGKVHVFTRQPDQTWVEHAALSAAQPASGDQLGAAIALQGELLAVGAPGSDQTAPDQGLVRLYHEAQPGQWLERGHLTHPDQALGLDFGRALAISPYGELIVSARQGADGRGVVYVYERDPLTRALTLAQTLSSTQDDASFGASLAVTDGRLAVGQPDAAGRGAALLYTRDALTGQYTLSDTLDDPQGSPGARFGQSLALARDELLVGAPAHDLGGAAYLFEDDAIAWRLERVITPEPTQRRAGHGLGTSALLMGGTLLVSAPQTHSAQEAAQSTLYILQPRQRFERQSHTLRAQPRSAGASFGASIARHGGLALVGAPGEDAERGAAYLLERNQGGADQWGIVARLVPTTREPGERFGASVALDAQRLVVGAPGHAQGAGRAVLFERHQGGANQWGERASYSGSAQDALGASVALTAQRMALASPGADASRGQVVLRARNQGGANAWGVITTLTAPSPTPGGRFGASIWLSDDLLWVGHPGVGRAEAFKRQGPSSWSHQQSLQGPAGSDAGQALIQRGDQLALGAPSLGQLQLYERGALWQLAHTISSPPWLSGAGCASALTMSDERLWSGCADAQVRLAQGAGQVVRVDDESPWRSRAELTRDQPAAQDRLGESLQADEDRLMVGAPGADAGQGVALIFTSTTTASPLPPSIDQPAPQQAHEPEPLQVSGYAPGARWIWLELSDALGRHVGSSHTSIGPSGAWTLTLPTLEPGDYTLTARERASARLSAPTQLALTILPARFVTLDSPGSMQTLATSAPTFSGRGRPGDVVQLQGRQVSSGMAAPALTLQATVDASGAWSAQAMGLADADYEVWASAGAARSSTLSFRVDTTGPTLTLLTPSEGQRLVERRPMFTGEVEGEPVTVALYNESADEATLTEEALVQGTRWSYQPSQNLTLGAWRAVASAQDAAGNRSEAQVRFTVEAPPLTVNLRLIEPADQALLADARPRWRGQINVQADVTLLVDGVALTTLPKVNGEFSWSGPYVTALADGPHTLALRAQVEDQPAVTSAPIRLTIDTQPPALELLTPTPDQVLRTDTPTLQGRGEPGRQVALTVDGQAWPPALVSSDGRWSATSASKLADGPHTVSATSRDDAGNLASIPERRFQIQAPSVIIDEEQAPGQVATTQPTFRGEAPEGSLITIIIVDAQGQEVYRGQTTSAEDGRWRHTVDRPLPVGDYTVIIEIDQPDGQKSRRTLTINVRDFSPAGFERAYCDASLAQATGGASPLATLALLGLWAAWARGARRRRAAP